MIQKILISCIKFYQFFISPLFGNSCMFDQTCSEYAKEALKKYGPIKGVAYSIWRILRCHPWSKNFEDSI